MYFMRIYENEEELPEDIKEIQFNRNDWDYIIYPNSINPREIDFAETLAQKLAVCDYEKHETKVGLVFYVTYHA